MNRAWPRWRWQPRHNLRRGWAWNICPFGRTTLGVEFRRAGQPGVRLPLDVTTPAPGRLKLTVLSDDTGKPAPAMVRLMWRTDGLARQPANGIEFAPQFDKQGKASGARNANLPGPLNETFWCVPGPFDMTLAPGDWQIGVRRGVEHEVIFRGRHHRFRGNRRSKRSGPSAGWTCASAAGGRATITSIAAFSPTRTRGNLMAWVQAEDIHLANVVKMGDIYRTYFEQRGFGPATAWSTANYVLSPGQECPRTHDQIGHTLAMNITSMVRNTGPLLPLRRSLRCRPRAGRPDGLRACQLRHVPRPPRHEHECAAAEGGLRRDPPVQPARHRISTTNS